MCGSSRHFYAAAAGVASSVFKLIDALIIGGMIAGSSIGLWLRSFHGLGQGRVISTYYCYFRCVGGARWQDTWV